MRRLILFTLLNVALAGPVLADDAHHPPTGKAAGTGTVAPAKQQAATPSKPAAPSQPEQQFAAAQEQMKKMLAQMEKIRQTKDPKERQRLMQEHMQTMHQGALEMRATGGGMMGEMMNCPMMQGKGMAANGAACPMTQGGVGKMEMGQRVDMMERRMDMMQMMMEQMIERERMSAPPARLP